MIPILDRIVGLFSPASRRRFAKSVIGLDSL